MMLVFLVALPFLGGVLAWLLERMAPKSARWVSLLTLLACLALTFVAWRQGGKSSDLEDWWLLEWRMPWLPQWGIEVHFGLDGLSFVLVLLTYVMGFLALTSSWNKVLQNAGFFYFCTMWIVTGVIGILLSIDLFLFFVFWEVMLIPLYLLVATWGYKDRIFATVQFFIFTQASGLFLLLSTVVLVFVHHAQTGEFTFDYNQLIGTSVPGPLQLWILSGFLIAFLVKLPAFPFHTWIAPLFAEGPLAPLLTGIMVKTGAYGLLRFALPLFPEAAIVVEPLMMTLGAFSVIYGAVLAFSQRDPRKVLAYSTLSHMGLILIGIFSHNELALSGVVVLMITQALSTGGLLMLFAHVRESVHEIELDKLGGLFKIVPGVGVLSLMFIMASVGLPGLGNFVGEWLVLLGTFGTNKVATMLAASGLVLGAIYSLWLMQRMFYGELKGTPQIADLTRGQLSIYGAMVAMLLWIGFYPAPVLDIVSPTWQDEPELQEPEPEAAESELSALGDES
jgi:NADH-quinone oxidoreductase subunit M